MQGVGIRRRGYESNQGIAGRGKWSAEIMKLDKITLT
jgi:hypothetical protein